MAPSPLSPLVLALQSMSRPPPRTSSSIPPPVDPWVDPSARKEKRVSPL